MTVKIYHNPRCRKSREALQWLYDRNITPEIVEYLKRPPTQDEFIEIINGLPAPANTLIRGKEAMDLNITPENLGETEVLELLCAHPEIMERPVVTTEKGSRIGRPADTIMDIL